MKDLAFVLLPLGGAATVGLVTGFVTVQRLAVKISKARLEVGRLRVSISSALLFYSLLRLCFVVRKLWEISATRAVVDGRVGSSSSETRSFALPVYPDAGMTGPSNLLQQQLFVRRMRAERDFWICTLTVILWLFVWWFGRLLTLHWKALDEEKEEGVDSKRATPSADNLPPPAPASRGGAAASSRDGGHREKSFSKAAAQAQPTELEMSADIGQSRRREGAKSEGAAAVVEEERKGEERCGPGAAIELTSMRQDESLLDNDKATTSSSSSSSASGVVHRRIVKH